MPILLAFHRHRAPKITRDRLTVPPEPHAFFDGAGIPHE